MRESNEALVNPVNKDKIAPILFLTFGLCSFLFTRIFAFDFHFLANSVRYLGLSAPLPVMVYFLLRNKSDNLHRLFFSLSVWTIVASGLNLTNSWAANSPHQVISIKIESVELVTGKYSRNYLAIFELPIDVSCCFIPEKKSELTISDEEAKSFKLGESKLEITYQVGYLGIPYLIKKKFIP